MLYTYKSVEHSNIWSWHIETFMLIHQFRSLMINRTFSIQWKLIFNITFFLLIHLIEWWIKHTQFEYLKIQIKLQPISTYQITNILIDPVRKLLSFTIRNKYRFIFPQIVQIVSSLHFYIYKMTFLFYLLGFFRTLTIMAFYAFLSLVVKGTIRHFIAFLCFRSAIH